MNNFEIECNIQGIKVARAQGYAFIQAIKDFPKTRESSLAITKAQEALMWLESAIKELNNSIPGSDSCTPDGDVAELTGDGLKL